MNLNRAIEIIESYLDLKYTSYKGKLINRISILKIIEKYYLGTDHSKYVKYLKANEKLYKEYMMVKPLVSIINQNTMLIDYVELLISNFLIKEGSKLK
jgi:hypothetical protein